MFDGIKIDKTQLVEQIYELATIRYETQDFRRAELLEGVLNLLGAIRDEVDPPENEEFGDLWWIADSDEEVARWTKEIEEAGGHVLEATPYADDPPRIDVFFNVPKLAAIARGWASGLDSDEWLEEEDD